MNIVRIPILLLTLITGTPMLSAAAEITFDHGLQPIQLHYLDQDGQLSGCLTHGGAGPWLVTVDTTQAIGIVEVTQARTNHPLIRPHTNYRLINHIAQNTLVDGRKYTLTASRPDRHSSAYNIELKEKEPSMYEILQAKRRERQQQEREKQAVAAHTEQAKAKQAKASKESDDVDPLTEPHC